MVFYLNCLGNDLEFYDFNVSFKRKLTKVDRIFIKFLLSSYLEKKEVFIEISKLEFKKKLLIETDEEILCFLDKFMQTKLFFSVKNDYHDGYQGAFNILDSYFLQKDSVVVVLSKEILLSFDENNLFSRMNLRCILDFENNNSLNIYLKILNLSNDLEEGFIEFSLKEFKELLEISNSYDRFYDFSKKVLDPIMDDLNTFSEYQVCYSKLKNSEGASSKIVGIKINYVNKKIKEFRKRSNELLTIIKDKVENFDVIYSIIFETIKLHGYSYVNENVKFVYTSENNKKNNKNFDARIIEALKENLSQMQEINKNHIVIEKNLKTPYLLHQEINKAFLKLEIESLIENHLFFPNFITDIYKLKDGDNYVFQSNEVKIKVNYNKNLKSKIEIIKI